MSYTGSGQFDRVTRGSTSFTNSALGLTREDATSFTHDPDGFVLGQRTPTRTYFLHDGLGSVVATTNETGQESAIARYAPFGTCLANCPAVPYRWLGGLGVYWDEPLQLHKMGTRYYDPALGRFTQIDPVEGGSFNSYEYAGQDPVNNSDADGQICIPCGVAVAVGVRVGTRLAARYGPRVLKAARNITWRGGEITTKTTPRDWRFSPFGHHDRLASVFGKQVRLDRYFGRPVAKGRAGARASRVPHYHRRPGIGRHRPWQGGP